MLIMKKKNPILKNIDKQVNLIKIDYSAQETNCMLSNMLSN